MLSTKRMKSSARTVNEYFESLDDDRREPLTRLRKLINDIWPTAMETMSDGMPAYRLDGLAFCAIASQKNFMALYIMPHDLLMPFKKDLLIYDRGRSCIRFKRLEEETFDLFDRILKYTGNQISESDLIAELARPNGRRR
ncbi:MAG: DUF1801 domain-containing protein [Flavobacteriales bacterium]|nr:DUF1801 domain-containing protein [Flavobacteriales bacterium]